MAGTAPQIREITTDEVRIISVDFSALLDSGELLTGTPDIQASDDLTITNAQVNVAAAEINGVSVPAGMAVQFQLESESSGKYQIEIVCDTDGGQRLEGTINLQVKRTKY